MVAYERELEIKFDYVDVLNSYALLLNAEGMSDKALRSIQQSLLRTKETRAAKNIFIACIKHVRLWSTIAAFNLPWSALVLLTSLPGPAAVFSKKSVFKKKADRRGEGPSRNDPAAERNFSRQCSASGGVMLASWLMALVDRRQVAAPL